MSTTDIDQLTELQLGQFVAFTQQHPEISLTMNFYAAFGTPIVDALKRAVARADWNREYLQFHGITA